MEKLFPAQPDERERFASALPKVLEIRRDLYGGRPLHEQLAIQAAAERAGSFVWRALAAGASDLGNREELLHCARLEEESAEVLERILSDVAARRSAGRRVGGGSAP